MRHVPHPDRPIRAAAAVCVALAVAGAALPAWGDRHCSFAREAAFYARELSGEAEQAPPPACRAKMEEALDRLRETEAQLAICSCSPAAEPLRRWYEDHPPESTIDDAGCHEAAASVNRIAQTVLTAVERCF